VRNSRLVLVALLVPLVLLGHPDVNQAGPPARPTADPARMLETVRHFA
jgi:hypothetical protein